MQITPRSTTSRLGALGSRPGHGHAFSRALPFLKPDLLASFGLAGHSTNEQRELLNGVGLGQGRGVGCEAARAGSLNPLRRVVFCAGVLTSVARGRNEVQFELVILNEQDRSPLFPLPRLHAKGSGLGWAEAWAGPGRGGDQQGTAAPGRRSPPGFRAGWRLLGRAQPEAPGARAGGGVREGPGVLPRCPRLPVPPVLRAWTSSFRVPFLAPLCLFSAFKGFTAF